MNNRIEKVNSSLNKCITNIINNKISDPRLDTMVTITSIETSSDLSVCKIKLSFLTNDKEKRKEILKIIQKSSGFIKSELSKMVKIRIIPELRFSIDEGIDNALRVEELLKQIHYSDEN